MIELVYNVMVVSCASSWVGVFHFVMAGGGRCYASIAKFLSTFVKSSDPSAPTAVCQMK